MSRGINHRWTRMDTDKVGVGLSFWGVWADPPPRRPRGSLFSILIANSPLAYYYVGWRANLSTILKNPFTLSQSRRRAPPEFPKGQAQESDWLEIVKIGAGG